MPKPKIQFLTNDDIKIIHENAIKILEEIGVKIENENVINLLKENGCDVTQENIVKIPRNLVEKCLSHVPHEFTLYDRDGKPYVVIGYDYSYFNPGSAAIKLFDPINKELREPVLNDLKILAILVNNLSNIQLLSTALIPHDIPIEIRDRIRLYPLLKYSNKPIVTGAFTVDGVYDMINMLKIVTDIEKKPCVIFDVCPSPPLKWSYITSQNIIDLAKYNIPIEIISMPQISATGPATIAGSLVIHHAEVLSGIVIAQCAKKGVPIIYGGSPSLFDVRYGTTPITAPEAMLLTLAYVDIAKYFKIPTHAYVGLSDSKEIDYQCGVESMYTALLAVLKGINICSGPGMIEFESVFSFEKLILDNDICGIVYRIAKGFEINNETLAIDVIKKVGPGGHFLTQKHTIKWYKIEHYLTQVIDRISRGKEKEFSLVKKCRELIESSLKNPIIHELSEDIRRSLDNYVQDLCKRYGVELLVS